MRRLKEASPAFIDGVDFADCVVKLDDRWTRREAWKLWRLFKGVGFLHRCRFFSNSFGIRGELWVWMWLVYRTHPRWEDWILQPLIEQGRLERGDGGGRNPR